MRSYHTCRHLKELHFVKRLTGETPNPEPRAGIRADPGYDPVITDFNVIRCLENRSSSDHTEPVNGGAGLESECCGNGWLFPSFHIPPSLPLSLLLSPPPPLPHRHFSSSSSAPFTTPSLSDSPISIRTHY
ncbi:hypothetical protein Baya_3547 [Bagarius yarrelli]|uniref:Uncharacterized protein n=1 Tax=Bagarius yarrelli TaxID=175774 RepID=A0A556TPK0_BAGYA|nr:hypothetical protein Baya_3547 [Bagarius yarrelli]